MFFVPSVQKPSASPPPPHSRISPLGLSETVQGSSAARAKPALAAPGTGPEGDPPEPQAGAGGCRALPWSTRQEGKRLTPFL